MGINNANRLYVNSGEKVFVRLHKRDNQNYRVYSNPKITYVNSSGQELINNEEDEQSGFYINNGNYSDNFLLNNQTKPLKFDEQGSLNISVPAVSFPKSTDDITFKIIKTNLTNDAETVLYTKTYTQSSLPFNTDSVNLNNITISSSEVPSIITAEVETNSHISFKNNNWNNIDLIFTPLSGNTKSYKLVPAYPSFYIREFDKKINIKDQASTIPSGVQNYGVQINKNLPVTFNNINPGSFYYIVKKGNQVLAKRRITVTTNNGIAIYEYDMGWKSGCKWSSPNCDL